MLSSEVVKTLKEDLEWHEQHLQWHAQQVECLRRVVAAVEDAAPPIPYSTRQDFTGLGIVDAATRLVLEESRSLSTTEIADGIAARGVTTKSKKYVATVYATLDNSPRFRRVGTGRSGRWALRSEASTDSAEVRQ